jgi:H+/Cl- antiporter ClcA
MIRTPHNAIPISVSLEPELEAEGLHRGLAPDKRRLLTIATLSVLVAVCISFIAKILVYLISLITNISFFGRVSLEEASPAHNSLGIWVIALPAIGGIIVGLMAYYGSQAIRGHGIPEAMEQILTNQSRIKPAITYLKPVSSAISIGTGGPFGAEGPIIATGGALGSTLGQLLHITHNERKILLAAGATAGMSAIFGSPIAAIFLAIELLLFEFSPRTIIPVALACITGAAGHHFLFGQGPVFPMKSIGAIPGNIAIGAYSVMGIVMGLAAVLVTKIVYFVEDSFEHLPVHWMWWPAIGGLGVGIVGYFAPRTLGVGYNNITDILTGSLSLQVVLALCVFKFISWTVALGSGTSGGTLAPLLTIGGACGALLGTAVIYLFPQAGITVPLAALVGMSAMFAGASRAWITSIVFALETTGQSNALLPLLAACTAAYFVSFLLMKNTIMTEKIARRGVKAPDSYRPDLLEQIAAGQVMDETGLVLSEDNTIREATSWLSQAGEPESNFFIITNNNGDYRGMLSSSNLHGMHHDPEALIGTLIRRRAASVRSSDNLRTAAELMAVENVDVLPVMSDEEANRMVGMLSYRHIISAYQLGAEADLKKSPHISMKRRGLRILVHGQRLIDSARKQQDQ